MGYSSNYQSADKIAHNQWLFDHLVAMNKEIKEIFKTEYENGTLKGCTPENKVEAFFYDVWWVESQLIPYLAIVDSPKRIVDPKEKHKTKRDSLIKKFNTLSQKLNKIKSEL